MLVGEHLLIILYVSFILLTPILMGTPTLIPFIPLRSTNDIGAGLHIEQICGWMNIAQALIAIRVKIHRWISIMTASNGWISLDLAFNGWMALCE